MTCKDCKYGAFDSLDEVIKVANESNGFRGICRRFPPSILIVQEGSPYVYTQPLVYEDGECGEYQPRGATSEKSFAEKAFDQINKKPF